MDIRDYLIEQQGKDWPKLLSDWVPPLPEEFTLWMVNRFGDLLIVTEDESIHLLDIGAGTVACVAESRHDFADKMDLEENANLWLMIPLVDVCVAAGMKLGPEQCYGFKMPPIFGGKYEVANIFPISLSEHYAFNADMQRQTKDLPDGAQVKLVIKPQKSTAN